MICEVDVVLLRVDHAPLAVPLAVTINGQLIVPASTEKGGVLRREVVVIPI